MDLQKIPTHELTAELCRRGAMMISTKTREPYKPGYRLEAVEYIHKEIKADRVLVLPPYAFVERQDQQDRGDITLAAIQGIKDTFEASIRDALAEMGKRS